MRKTNPGVGWVRADQVPDESSPKEILKLRKRIEELEAEREELRTTAPTGTDDFAQGDDEYAIQFRVRVVVSTGPQSWEQEDRQVDIEVGRSWYAIFNRVAPLMINESDEWDLKRSFQRFLSTDELAQLKESQPSMLKVDDVTLHDESFHTIIIQLRSLGLIVESAKQRSVKDTSLYWKLTPYGDSLMTKLRAIRRTGDTKPK